MTEFVQIGSGAFYDTYATVEQADEYLDASATAASWRALTDPDDKARFLVTATRTLDRQNWLGEKTDAAQPLAWPRTGTGIDGVEDTVVPQAIINACIELAAALVDDTASVTSQNTEQSIQSLRAGSAAITFFRGAGGEPSRFPFNIMELIRDYLAGTSTSFGVISSGTDNESVTADDFGYSESL